MLVQVVVPGKAGAAVLFRASRSVGSLQVIVKALLPLELPFTAWHSAQISSVFVVPVHFQDVLSTIANPRECPIAVLFGAREPLIPVRSTDVRLHIVHSSESGATV